MGLSRPYRHKRSLNNTIPPYEDEDSDEIINKLKDYKVTLCGEKNKNRRD